MFKWHYFDIIKILSYYVTLFEFIEIRGVRGGGPRPPPPSTRAPSERLRGAPMGEALLILHLLAFPILRSGTGVYLGG